MLKDVLFYKVPCNNLSQVYSFILKICAINYSKNHNLIIIGSSNEQLKPLSNYIWSYQKTLFLPNLIIEDEINQDNLWDHYKEKCILTQGKYIKNNILANSIINLQDEFNKNILNSSKIYEFILGESNDETITKARNKYKEYLKLKQSHNFNISYNDIPKYKWDLMQV